MILGIEQDMETLIQASNGKLRFVTHHIQLREKMSGSGASVAAVGAGATGVPFSAPGTSRAGGSQLAGSSSHKTNRPGIVGAGVKSGPPAPPDEGMSSSKYSASASRARTAGPCVQPSTPGPSGEGNGGGGRPTMPSSVARARGEGAHLTTLKAPGTDNRSNCPPVLPIPRAKTVDVGIHSSVPGPSSKGNGGGPRRRVFSSLQPRTSVVVAGVPDVLADSTGPSASARPSATERISAPPSNKKKKN